MGLEDLVTDGVKTVIAKGAGKAVHEEALEQQNTQRDDLAKSTKTLAKVPTPPVGEQVPDVPRNVVQPEG